MNGAVKTGKVADRRTLRFRDFSELWADVESIAEAERTGRLRRIGNWTVGQILTHLAAWVEYSSNGYPPELRAPWFVRLIMRFQKRKFLYDRMPAGVEIPGVPGGTLATSDAPTPDAMQRLHAAWERLLREPPRVKNLLFGEMTHDEWIQLNLRHAELHLSFLRPGG